MRVAAAALLALTTGALTTGAISCAPSLRTKLGISREEYRAAREGCRWEARYRRFSAHPDAVFRWCQEEIARSFEALEPEQRDSEVLGSCLTAGTQRIDEFEGCMEAAGWSFRGTWSPPPEAALTQEEQIESCSAEAGPGRLESYAESVSVCIAESAEDSGA